MGLVRASLPISGPAHYWFKCARCEIGTDRAAEPEDQDSASPSATWSGSSSCRRRTRWAKSDRSIKGADASSVQ